MFVIGDASGSAKGAVVVYQHGLDYESGTWSEEWMGKSSNVREAESLTDSLERLAAESVGLATQVVERLETLNTVNALADHKVFVLTDNSPSRGPTTRATQRAGSSATLCFACTSHSGREVSFYMSYTSRARG